MIIKMLNAGKFFVLASNMLNSVTKIPKGGKPVIAINPIRKIIPVTGKTDKNPLISLTLVELYLIKIVPPVRKRTDLINEW
jgi:hypothetical protein